MAGRDRRLARWRMRYPRLTALDERARRRIPHFAFDFLQGGTGDELSRPRNIAALQAIKIVPRYGVDVSRVNIAARLFGRAYRAPVVISPIGMDGAIRPGATRHLAETARDTGLAYMTGTLATASLEHVARIAPEVGGVAWLRQKQSM